MPTCTEKSSILPSQGNFSFQHTETTPANPNQSNCRAVEPSPNGYVHEAFPYLRLREHCQRGRQKNCKSQRIRSSLWLSLRNVGSYTHRATLKTGWRSAPKTSALTGNYWQLRKSVWECLAFPKKENNSWTVQRKIVSQENIQTGSITCIEQDILRNIYVYIYM